MSNPFADANINDIARFLRACDFSEKQTAWLSPVLRSADCIQHAALSIVLANKFGPDMAPVETTDEELQAGAAALLQQGFLLAWTPGGVRAQ